MINREVTLINTGLNSSRDNEIPGVSYNKAMGKWRVRFKTGLKGKQKELYCGSFQTRVEAVMMRILMERVLYPEDRQQESVAYNYLFNNQTPTKENNNHAIN